MQSFPSSKQEDCGKQTEWGVRWNLWTHSQTRISETTQIPDVHLKEGHVWPEKEGCSFHSTFVKTLSVLNVHFYLQNLLEKNSQVCCRKHLLHQWTWNHPRLWKRCFCPLLLFWPWCPSAGYCSLLSLKCIEKQECAGKDLIIPYCSPQTLQEVKK